jgi:hypothetical protein
MTPDRPSSRWERVIDCAIMHDLFYAIYGEKKWVQTELYTTANGKYADDMRRSAEYLDNNEQTTLNNLACHLVYLAFETARLQDPDAPTESLLEIFDLAINFISHLAVKFQNWDHSPDDPPPQMTSVEFTKFRDHHSAYDNGKGLIFQRDSEQARRFLMATYKFGLSYNLATSYFGGNALHLYMGPRRTFGMKREHSLIDDLLREFGLAALIKEGKYSQYSGPLDEVTANYILSGPFKFEMCDRIQDHLTFKLDGHIVLYNINRFDYLVLFRNCLAE